MHIAEAKAKLGSRITWLSDSIDNDLKHALGDAPNSEFIIDPSGQIISARQWSDPQALRADLARLVGEVRPATTIAEVGMKPLSPPKTAPTGIVPRVELPTQMSPIKIEPLSDPKVNPYYAKLRVEADSGALRGNGKLYLGFFLDPLYKVHWNNLADPIHFEIEAEGVVEVTPEFGDGPQVEADADADPREFLVDVKGRPGSSFVLTVFYFACDDAETFCKPVKQRYRITLERDRDGGSRRSTRRQPSRRSPMQNGIAANRQAMMETIILFRALDRNGNRKISSNEINQAPVSLRRLDANRDGEITRDEILSRSTMMQRFGR